MSGFGKRISLIPAPAAADAALAPLVLALGGQAVAPPARSNTSPAKNFIRNEVLQRIEPAIAVQMTTPDLTARVNMLVAEIATEQRLLLNGMEQQELGHEIVDDMVGLGPLESLLRDTTVSDILINGAHQIYVERRGKLELTPL